MIVRFYNFLKDYLEFENISQSDFALRLGISQKHMNEILNGKKNITFEMASSISLITDIDISFILNVEKNAIAKEKILKDSGSIEEIQRIVKQIKKTDIEKLGWFRFTHKEDVLESALDILKYLKVISFKGLKDMNKNVLFKRKNNDLLKVNLWVARCDRLAGEQKLNNYSNLSINDIVLFMNNEAYNKQLDINKITKYLNNKGIFFIYEDPLPGTSVRGLFKVMGKHPAVYITSMHKNIASIYFALLHEIAHCKSDYNMGKSKTFMEDDGILDERADKQALEWMIPSKIWVKIKSDYSISNLLNISRDYKISMSYIVSRLAHDGLIEYSCDLYNKYIYMFKNKESIQ